MKIELFRKSYEESLQDFENRVNDFMATVEVIDVKINVITALGGSLLQMITVLYKDNQKQTN
ncbi:hypothetical protein ACHBHL_05510 [Streptococcus sp. A27]|uniref:hypothetical protein n=1 Tax=unclassified Streptococcus TaxID=2608887 RepID=UPI00374D2325